MDSSSAVVLDTRDPDGNNVEITAQNHASLNEMAAFMACDAFKANPSGVEIDDPAGFVARRRETAMVPA